MNKQCSSIALIMWLSLGPAYSQDRPDGSVQNRISVVGAKETDEAGRLATNAQILSSQGQFAAAEAGFRKALGIWSKTPPHNMLEKANCLNNYGLLLFSQGNLKEAIPFYKEALTLEDSPNMVNPKAKQLSAITAITLDNMGQAYRLLGDLEVAEPLYKRALKIEEETLAADDQDMAITKINLSCLYIKRKDYKSAEPLLAVSLPVLKKSLGAKNPNYLQCLDYYIFLLRETNRQAEAEALEKSK